MRRTRFASTGDHAGQGKDFCSCGASRVFLNYPPVKRQEDSAICTIFLHGYRHRHPEKTATFRCSTEPSRSPQEDGPSAFDPAELSADSIDASSRDERQLPVRRSLLAILKSLLGTLVTTSEAQPSVPYAAADGAETNDPDFQVKSAMRDIGKRMPPAAAKGALAFAWLGLVVFGLVGWRWLVGDVTATPLNDMMADMEATVGIVAYSWVLSLVASAYQMLGD